MPTMLFTALRKYAVFSGRARRKEFWQFNLLVIVLTIVASLIDRAIGMPTIAGLDDILGGPFENIVSIATLVPGLAVGWRRMQDIGRRGWWYGAALASIGVIIFVGRYLTAGGPDLPAILAASSVFMILAVMVYLLTREGTPGPNAYGPDPKAAERGAAGT